MVNNNSLIEHSLSVCCFGSGDQVPHLMPKEEASTYTLEAERGVEPLGLRVIAIDDKSYALVPLRKRPLA